MSATKNPCTECPFKNNSAKGYLGGFSVETTLEVAKSEASFLCHLTRETDNEKECSGRLLFTTKICKSFRNPDLEDLRLEAKRIIQLLIFWGSTFRSTTTKTKIRIK